MFIPGLLMLGASRISRNSAYNWAACAFFAADLLSALTITYSRMPAGGVIALAASYIALSLGLIIFFRKKLGFTKLWERVAVYYAGGVWFFLLLDLWGGGHILKSPSLSFLLIPGLLLLGVGRVTRNSAYKIAANVFFAADFTFMLAAGYRELTQVGTIAAPLGYMLLFIAILWLQWPPFASAKKGAPSALSSNPSQTSPPAESANNGAPSALSSNPSQTSPPAESANNGAPSAPSSSLSPTFPPVASAKKDASMPARLAAYGVVFLSLTVILLGSGIAHRAVILLISLTALAIALFLSHYDESAARYAPLHITMRVVDYVLYAISVCAIAFTDKPTPGVIALYWVLAVLALSIGFVRVRDVLKNQHTGEHILICFMITGVTLAVIRGFATNWFDAVYVLSLANMVSALFCVIIGFICRTKALRLYGLILTLLCVVKLITYDVRGLDTTLRIVSLISGGIICFAISALYSYSEERLKRSAERKGLGFRG